MVKNPLALQETQIRSLGQGAPLEKTMEYSCLVFLPATPVFLPGNSMERGAWWVTVHGVPKSRTKLSN